MSARATAAHIQYLILWILWFLGEDSCNGDSGGPLVYRPTPDSPWYQVGVVSFGTTKCGVGKPGVYTRLSVFIPWIERHLEA